MCRSRLSTLLLLGVVVTGTWRGLWAAPRTPDRPPIGPFGFSRITTPDGKPGNIESFEASETCGACHEREWNEFNGSMHSASHGEAVYRNFAELARKEAGNDIYALCSGCHAPAGVVTGLIPKQRDDALPDEAKAGVTCDVCHQVSAITGEQGPWGEPGNASIVLQPGPVKYGDSGAVAENRAHTAERRDFFAKAEFCASCHTVIHPVNGLRIESTYEEWKGSVYAQKGIQCQDCHMRSVEEAVRVAETLRPVVIEGPRVTDGEAREIFRHYFVGGNANADRLAGGKEHAAAGEARLKSAARLELTAPSRAAAGEPLRIEVVVRNVAAGHNIPTGVTELREMWIDLRIADSQGQVLFHSGALDAKGDLPGDAVRFGAVAVDHAGKKTVRPWEMVRLSDKRTVPPKGIARETITARLPTAARGPLTVQAKLFYRSVAPSVVAMIMDAQAFSPKVVEMASARAAVTVDK